MELKLLSEMKEYWPLLIAMGWIIATSSVTLWRVKRIESILLNGGNGLIQQTEQIKIQQAIQSKLCEERHPHHG